MNALDASFEAVSMVFLIAAMIYSARLLQLTKDAQIVALSKPKTVFRLMTLEFAFLLISPALALVSNLILPIPYTYEIQNLLVIFTAFSGVTAIYTALYFYRTSPDRVQVSTRNRNRLGTN